MMTYLFTMIFFVRPFFTLLYPFGMLKGAMILSTGAAMVIGPFMADGNVVAAPFLWASQVELLLAVNNPYSKHASVGDVTKP